MIDKKSARVRRGMKVRCNLRRAGVRRLVVHRTLKHIYAQIISSDNMKVLVSASTLEKDIRGKLKCTGNKYAASLVGQIIAERAIRKNFCDVSFDRSGFKYHGRIQALAESSRKFGMKF